MTKRILIDRTGADGIRLAFAEAQSLCMQMNCDLIICTPDKKTVKDSGLNEVLQPGHLAKITRGLSVQLSSTITATLESQRTLTSKVCPEVILALYGSSVMMDKIDALVECNGVVMVPLDEEGKAAWRKKWNPRIVSDAIRESA